MFKKILYETKKCIALGLEYTFGEQYDNKGSMSKIYFTSISLGHFFIYISPKALEHAMEMKKVIYTRDNARWWRSKLKLSITT